jgi:RNA polymerase sigma-70 factor (ECF subfamily)
METEDTRRLHADLQQRLRPFVARRVPSSDVDDVLQDIFLRMQRALPALRDEERFAPWIFRIAHSAVVESHRQRARQPIARDGEIEPVATSTEKSGASAVEQEVAAYLVETIATLPSPYREALTLTEIEGVTQQAAADLAGISLSGMKSRVQRGREQLRARLEACCRIGVDARGRVIDCEPKAASDCRCSSADEIE